jgi:hypothetical protein
MINFECSLRIHYPLPDASCPVGYSKIGAPAASVPAGVLCKSNLYSSRGGIAQQLPDKYCTTGYHQVFSGASTRWKCYRTS